MVSSELDPNPEDTDQPGSCWRRGVNELLSFLENPGQGQAGQAAPPHTDGFS